ncbi:trypsin-like serine protease [Streptomyces sp. MUM 178J]|uniref:trypsin-like serine protease n=1 Tax=Streptomyces sp. MUM 178J TaxID=2791991 RepID=UPI001F04C482|nr:FG-GAP-like repeat-containing protein [Streptomyces sp. MUM 178J]WRQ81823.1 trypsin-like serine protease [Streptomyces sp. MUM 178J]
MPSQFLSRRTSRCTLAAAAAIAAAALGSTPALAVSGGQAADGSRTFAAQIDVGDTRGCTGALVDPQWILTAASCFAETPGGTVAAGKPAQPSTATLGSTDLLQPAARTVAITEVVPRSDRDLVMARLAEPVTDVAPVQLAVSAPQKGETLEAMGYGRTATGWAPDRLHSGEFGIDAVDGATIGLAAKGDAAICKGDTGGPAVRITDGRPELVALHSRSWQGGCLGSEETRTGALDTRVDDINPWIQQVRSLPRQHAPLAGDFSGDGKADFGVLSDLGKTPQGRNHSALTGFTSDGDGFKAPRTLWDSGTGSWYWGASKPVAGDFNGDGKDDVAVLYRYGRHEDGRYHSGLWTFLSNGAGFEKPLKVWDSGSGSWSWERSKPVAGDFNGDGKADLGVLYDYGKLGDGRNHSGLWTFASNGAGFEKPLKVWDSGSGSWSWERSKPVAGDFNGDGKADLGVLYDYGKLGDGRNHSGLWTFASNGAGFEKPLKVWDSGSGSWSWERSKPVAGDFNGDGKADLGVLYDYGKLGDGRNHSGLWTFASNGAGFEKPLKVWDSGSGSWSWERSEPVAGDFNDDGKTDLGALYDYGTTSDGRSHTGVWSFTSTGGGFEAPVKHWSSKIVN